MSTTGWLGVAVPPGSESGQFYIPIGNLPFLVHWQELKDWLKEACDVDYVEVCGPTRGSGWIRVKGQENFRRALHRLNNVPFHNRALIAQDRNRNLAIPIFIVSNDPKGQDSRQIHGGDDKSKNRAETEPLVVSSNPRWMHANQAGDGLTLSPQVDEGAFTCGDGRV